MTRTPYTPIAEGSQATPGLWNAIFSALSTDLDVVLSGATSTFSSNVTVTGGVTLVGPLSVQSGPVHITTNSNVSDYIYFTDSSNARSNYIIGSFNSRTADGLNIWDDSGQTMIVSFSKQSVRFFQQIIGPVFDLGGALTGTYNAATFGTAADSKESRITAAIAQAGNSGVSAVYVPKSMIPYNAANVSFNSTVHMVCEGGNPDTSIWDMRAYGAHADNSTDDDASLVAIINGIGFNGSGTIEFQAGTTQLGGAYTFTVPTMLMGVPGSTALTALKSGTFNFLTFNIPQTGQFNCGMYGLFLYGTGTASGSTGILLGGTSGSNLFSMDKTRISNWGSAVVWANNSAFHTFFRSFFVSNGRHLLFPTSVTNSGEALCFYRCSFHNAPTAGTFASQISIAGTAGGEFEFNGCSFDDVGFTMNGGSIILDGCHFELIGNVTKGQPMFSQTGGFLQVDNLKVFLDPTSGITATEMFTISGGTSKWNGIDAFSNQGGIGRLIAFSGAADTQIMGQVQLTGFNALYNNAAITTGSLSGFGPGIGFSPIVRSTAAYTITRTDNVILASAAGGAITVTLPSVAGFAGATYTIKKTDSSANSVTIWSGGAPTIDGGATIRALVTPNESLTLITDGTNWFVI